MEIVDSQFHEPTPQAPWTFGEESEVAVGAELAREAIDCVGVDAAIVNASAAACRAAVERYPARFAGCPFAGRAADAQPTPLVEVWDDDIDGAIAAFGKEPGMVGLRVVIRTFKDGALTADYTEGRNDPIFAAAEKHGVPIFLQAAGHMSAAADIARKYAGLTLIIDHLGLNQVPADIGDEPWADVGAVTAVAQCPNTSLKLCGGSTLTSSDYPHPDVWPHYLRLIEAFTPDRVMWASDFTRLRKYHRNLADELHFIRDTDQLSQSDKEKILGATCRRLLDWPAAA